MRGLSVRLLFYGFGRIISLRKALNHEREPYEQAFGNRLGTD